MVFPFVAFDQFKHMYHNICLKMEISSVVKQLGFVFWMMDKKNLWRKAAGINVWARLVFFEVETMAYKKTNSRPENP